MSCVPLPFQLVNMHTSAVVQAQWTTRAQSGLWPARFFLRQLASNVFWQPRILSHCTIAWIVRIPRPFSDFGMPGLSVFIHQLPSPSQGWPCHIPEQQPKMAQHLDAEHFPPTSHRQFQIALCEWV
ncbi:hypothetical protein DL89DRAFT_148633 [Linderina pennispora]|uniref:Uncharacterized protein n=1 Tax=Linderina pennispora TaxID=61395 RepID=A0A1Y1W9Q5_9FUNG|nr:uncharacterized protein DL89DRAFT_148633 [Linderina pennispora]ORX69884.1 hypothetical protein DL89DRAFT_148633 [Linderina pennispora]